MNFHAEFFPATLPCKISHEDKILLIGSCFTEQIGNKLAAHKFKILQNPNGILFNPVSIAQALQSYCNKKEFKESDLFYHNELWASWHYHTSFSHPQKEVVLQRINHSLETASNFLKEAGWLIITLGSAFVYERKELEGQNIFERVVANCHKIPNDTFLRRLMNPEEIKKILRKMTEEIAVVNPCTKILYTISPVRHLREGFIENNRSKAALIQAVHELTDNKKTFYFPAYELVIDDLRDYRFFAEDMVHPNYAATNYVWEKFVSIATTEKAQTIMRKVNEINAAIAHKPFNETSSAHQKFKASYLQKVKDLKEEYPGLELREEKDFFS